MDVPGFNLISKISESENGTIWTATQLSLDRIVALKSLPPALYQDEDAVDQYITEARAAAKLKHHGLIHLYNVVEHEGEYFFVLEYVEGDTIKAHLQEDGTIPWKQALKIAMAVSDALDDAWETEQLIHHNIKPGNILIDNEGNVKLSDMGVANKIDPSLINVLTEEGPSNGKVNYLSPEQAAGSDDIDFRSDMYGLGCTIYHMVTGVMPFQDSTSPEVLRLHAEGHLKNPRDVKSTIPLGVVRLLERLMMKDPAKRYKSWNDVTVDLGKALEGKLMLAKRPDDPSSTTIAPPTSATARKAAASPARSAAAVTAAPQSSLPFGVQAAAWGFLLVWFIALGFWRFDQVRSKPAPTPAPPAPVVPKPQPKPRPNQPGTPSPVKPANVTPKPVKDPGPIIEKPVQPVVRKTLTEAEKSRLEALKKEMVAPMLARNFSEPRKKISAELKKGPSAAMKNALKETDKVLADLEQIDNVILDSFKKKEGKTVLITSRGRKIRTTIKKVEGSRINVVVSSMSKGREIKKDAVLTLDALEPKEMIKWLGETDTTAKKITKYILLNKAWDEDGAIGIAQECGPFAEVFAQRLQ